jgi:hypothetical protein
MWIFIATTAGACLLIVTWAIGLSPDVGGLIALAFIALGILAQMMTRQATDQER